MKDTAICESDEVACFKSKIFERLPKIMEDPVIREFLEVEGNRKAFDAAINSFDESKLKDLDERFKEFYRLNRISRYLTGLIKRYSIDFDKRVKLRNNRFQLIMDKPVRSGKEDSVLTMGNLLTSTDKTPYDILEERERLKENIFVAKNQLLQESLEELESKQIEILYLKYEEGYSNKEIGKFFGQTEQNISYWHKKTIKQLKKSMELKESDSIGKRML